MSPRKVVSAFVVLVGLLSWPTESLGIAFNIKVVSRGQKAKALPGWPKGVMRVINHPLRSDGWSFFFSGCANDNRLFVMRIRGTEDVNALLKVLAGVKAKKIILRLDPSPGVKLFGRAGAVFSLGNQSLLDDWYKRLPQARPGVRVFGVHRYRKTPSAQPPTLTVYTGRKGFDLKKLSVPVNIEVAAPALGHYRKQYEERCVAIDEFLDRLRVRRKKMK